MKQRNETGSIEDLSLYRIETAKGDLQSAKILSLANFNKNYVKTEMKKQKSRSKQQKS